MAKLEWTGRSRNFKRHAATEAATSDHLHLPPFMPWSTAMVNGLAGPRCPTINACADGSGLSSSRFVYEPCVLLTERLRGAKWLLEDDRFRRHIAVSIWLDLAGGHETELGPERQYLFVRSNNADPHALPVRTPTPNVSSIGMRVCPILFVGRVQPRVTGLEEQCVHPGSRGLGPRSRSSFHRDVSANMIEGYTSRTFPGRSLQSRQCAFVCTFRRTTVRRQGDRHRRLMARPNAEGSRRADEKLAKDQVDCQHVRLPAMPAGRAEQPADSIEFHGTEAKIPRPWEASGQIGPEHVCQHWRKDNLPGKIVAR